jgi:hypothetical protein
MADSDTPEPEALHSLRNHIAVVVSFSELLLGELPADDRRHRDVLEIRKAALAAMAMLPEVTALVRGR